MIILFFINFNLINNFLITRDSDTDTDADADGDGDDDHQPSHSTGINPKFNETLILPPKSHKNLINETFFEKDQVQDPIPSSAIASSTAKDKDKDDGDDDDGDNLNSNQINNLTKIQAPHSIITTALLTSPTDSPIIKNQSSNQLGNIIPVLSGSQTIALPTPTNSLQSQPFKNLTSTNSSQSNNSHSDTVISRFTTANQSSISPTTSIAFVQPTSLPKQNSSSINQFSKSHSSKNYNNLQLISLTSILALII
ncbi:hypothetical protein O181_077473 [Austropuccinia psidii MF-1]|uniref:Uncharacterized protein n=1 Tax=Austropuccinia psidii MF-1 TaxID=1389203 RepID=A0A9Q3IDR6_9BASI|nr:hypothetical protein [Austropuccinia psidii MF-1]